MENRQVRTVEMFQRVVSHLEHERPIDPPPPLQLELSQSLVDIVARVWVLQLRQGEATRAASAGHLRRYRQRVRDGMRAVVRIARPKLAFAPGAEALLRVPHVRADAAATAQHAMELATVLAPHVDLFAAANLPDILDRLAEDARLLATAAASADAQEERARATAGIQREVEEGMAAVDMLEGIMLGHCGPADSPKMRQWREIRRVHARLGRPRGRQRTPKRAGAGRRAAN